MATTYVEPSDAELDASIVHFARCHAVKLVKAPITASMAAFSVLMFSDSAVKAVAIALCYLVLCAFNTWRRILEPITLVLFIAAAATWCNPAVLSFLKPACYR